MRVFRNVVLVLMLVGFAAFGSGCLVVAAGAAAAGTVAYVRGDLESTMDADAEHCTRAARSTVDDLKLIYLSSVYTSIDGRVMARKADDTKVEIRINAQGEHSSKVAIRVGVFGDQPLSMQILQKMRTHLNDPPEPDATTRSVSAP